MQEYRRVPREAESNVPSNEIRVSSTRSVASCIGHAASFLLEQHIDPVVMRGLRGAIPTVILSVEMLRRRIVGLEVVWTLEEHNVVDRFEPLKEELNEVIRETSLPAITATISLHPLDPTLPGYQTPLAPELVEEKTLAELTGKKLREIGTAEQPEPNSEATRGGRRGRGGRRRPFRGARY